MKLRRVERQRPIDPADARLAAAFAFCAANVGAPEGTSGKPASVMRPVAEVIDTDVELPAPMRSWLSCFAKEASARLDAFLFQIGGRHQVRNHNCVLCAWMGVWWSIASKKSQLCTVCMDGGVVVDSK